MTWTALEMTSAGRLWPLGVRGMLSGKNTMPSLHTRRNVSVLACIAVLFGCAQPEPSRPILPDDRPIAHVSHDGIEFSVAIDPENANRLAIVVFEKAQAGAHPPQVKIKLAWRRDGTPMEGLAESQASAGNAGTIFWRYRFDAGRAISLPDVNAIAVEIEDQAFLVFPWGEAPLSN